MSYSVLQSCWFIYFQWQNLSTLPEIFIERENFKLRWIHERLPSSWRLKRCYQRATVLSFVAVAEYYSARLRVSSRQPTPIPRTSRPLCRRQSKAHSPGLKRGYINHVIAESPNGSSWKGRVWKYLYYCKRLRRDTYSWSAPCQKRTLQHWVSVLKSISFDLVHLEWSC